MKRIGVYPGSFDPVTNGHMDIIRRAARLVDHLVIGVATNASKSPLFTLDERVEIMESEVAPFSGKNGFAEVSVRPFECLLIQFAKDMNATVIVRGLRAVSDFDYEFQMTGMNSRLDRSIETVFLAASESNQFIASSLVKEIAKLNGDIHSFVSPAVAERMVERVRELAN